jgi:preprotein translocase subunit SecE
MARNTRQQRRARRREAAGQSAEEQQAPQPQPGAARPRARQQPARQPVTTAKPQAAAHREPKVRGRFVRESYAELRKVEWPNRSQVLTGSVVVIIACAIVGVYLWVADLALQRLVERVLL